MISKPVSIAARNVKVGDTLQVDLGVRQWGKVLVVTVTDDSVYISTDNHLIGAINVLGRCRVTVRRGTEMKA